jgi:hypothetical protein
MNIRQRALLTAATLTAVTVIGLATRPKPAPTLAVASTGITQPDATFLGYANRASQKAYGNQLTAYERAFENGVLDQLSGHGQLAGSLVIEHDMPPGFFNYRVEVQRGETTLAQNFYVRGRCEPVEADSTLLSPAELSHVMRQAYIAAQQEQLTQGLTDPKEIHRAICNPTSE